MSGQWSEGTYGELVETQHVHDAYLGNDCPKEVRPLITAGSYQQAAIGASLHDTRMVLSYKAVTKNEKNQRPNTVTHQQQKRSASITVTAAVTLTI